MKQLLHPCSLAMLAINSATRVVRVRAHLPAMRTTRGAERHMQAHGHHQTTKCMYKLAHWEMEMPNWTPQKYQIWTLEHIDRWSMMSMHLNFCIELGNTCGDVTCCALCSASPVHATR